MAENESLDLGSPNARRWDEISDGFRKRHPWEKLARKISKKLHEALRKAWKQLAERGVPFEQLLAMRESPITLNQLVKKLRNHPYAVLFRDVCLSESTKSARMILQSYLWNAWEVISDQIVHTVAASAPGLSIMDLQIAVNEVNNLLAPDIQRVANQLAEKPSEVPRRLAYKGEKIDPTTEMLPMSLLGVQKP